MALRVLATHPILVNGTIQAYHAGHCSWLEDVGICGVINAAEPGFTAHRYSIIQLDGYAGVRNASMSSGYSIVRDFDASPAKAVLSVRNDVYTTQWMERYSVYEAESRTGWPKMRNAQAVQYPSLPDYVYAPDLLGIWDQKYWVFRNVSIPSAYTGSESIRQLCSIPFEDTSQINVEIEWRGLGPVSRGQITVSRVTDRQFWLCLIISDAAQLYWVDLDKQLIELRTIAQSEDGVRQIWWSKHLNVFVGMSEEKVLVYAPTPTPVSISVPELYSASRSVEDVQVGVPSVIPGTDYWVGRTVPSDYLYIESNDLFSGVAPGYANSLSNRTVQLSGGDIALPVNIASSPSTLTAGKDAGSSQHPNKISVVLVGNNVQGYFQEGDVLRINDGLASYDLEILERSIELYGLSYEGNIRDNSYYFVIDKSKTEVGIGFSARLVPPSNTVDARGYLRVRPDQRVAAISSITGTTSVTITVDHPEWLDFWAVDDTFQVAIYLTYGYYETKLVRTATRVSPNSFTATVDAGYTVHRNARVEMAQSNAGKGLVARARVMGSVGEPCAGELVTWSVSGVGEVSPVSSRTNEEGYAYTLLRTGVGEAGTSTVTASVEP